MVLRNCPEREYLLIYGAGASEVMVGKIVLEKVELRDIGSVLRGWCFDARNNRVVVKVPTGMNTGMDREIQVKF